jgi:polyphenol oxidase
VLRGEAVDLPAAARAALTAHSLPADAVTAVGACTACASERFFSFRRDGAAAGRQAGLVWIAGGDG